MSARRISSAVVLLVCLSWAALAPRPRAQTRAADSVVAIRGATILTATRGTIQNGTIVLRGGRIAAVGANVPVPSGAEIMDGAGKFVSPGIIDCHSHIAADSINEGGTTVSSMTGIEDVFDPTDVDIYRDLAGGVTTANVLHGSANPIGGKNYVIKLRWGRPRAEEFAFEGAMPGIKFALGENPKRRGGGAGAPLTGPRAIRGRAWGSNTSSATPSSARRRIRSDWQEYDRRKKGGENAVPPRRDLQLEPLVEILEGKRLVHAHAYRADEILMLLRVADEFGFKIATLQHVLEGYKVAKEIAAHGAGASSFADWWGYKIEAFDAIPYNAALMTRKGVLVSINSDSAELARHLNTEAAKSIKWGGLTDDEALALVTINPAKQLRIDNRVGSLEVGKDADVTIWSHHPLSSYAIVERVYIDGQSHYDRLDDQKRLTDLVRDKTSLVNAERSERRPPTSTEPDRPQSPRSSDAVTGTNGSIARDDRSANGLRATSECLRATSDTPSCHERRASSRSPTRGSSPSPGRRSSAAPSSSATASSRASARTSACRPARRSIDAAGADVYPGFINARTAIGLADPGAGGFDDADEVLDFNPQLRAQVAFHNDSEAIPVLRANGVTTVAVTPGGGILGGQIAVMNLDGYTYEESSIATGIGISFQFPRLGGDGRGGRGGPPQSRSYEEREKGTRRTARSACPPAGRCARIRESVGLEPSARSRARVAGSGRRDAGAVVHEREHRAGDQGCGGIRRTRRRPDRHQRGERSVHGRRPAEGKERARDPQRRPEPSDAGGPAASIALCGRRRAGQSRRQARVCRAERDQRAPAAVPRGSVGRLGSPARRGDQGADDQRRRDPRRRRPDRQHRGRQDREPDRGERRSARGAHRDHSRRHRRARRSARQQTPGALRAVFEEALTMKRFLCLAAALAAVPFVALRGDVPLVYAIRGARIVTAAGTPIESGTIVIRGADDRRGRRIGRGAV